MNAVIELVAHKNRDKLAMTRGVIDWVMFGDKTVGYVEQFEGDAKVYFVFGKRLARANAFVIQTPYASLDDVFAMVQKTMTQEIVV